ncbi:uncharacterized protein LOC124310225 [Neodiprion virginianus]|uniref:uncharacterized protein LOC124310225 n=1 Tax=Neodiprion virginianus TaxID=2961670 RepID=UPI001EE77ED7|nr:uncharacterized protein LOC124310225 [Neodiprion virginianus]
MDSELLRITKLKRLEDWGTRKFQVRTLILASEALEVTTGESVKPELEANANAGVISEHSRLLRAWRKLYAIAQKIIVTTVSDQPLLHIINGESARKMWQKLHDIFENKSETAEHILQQQWYTIGKDQGNDIPTHIAKVKDLAQHLSVLGEPSSDSMVMTKVLMTLPLAYSHFTTAWESTSVNQRTLSNLIARRNTNRGQ